MPVLANTYDYQDYASEDNNHVIKQNAFCKEHSFSDYKEAKDYYNTLPNNLLKRVVFNPDNNTINIQVCPPHATRFIVSRDLYGIKRVFRGKFFGGR